MMQNIKGRTKSYKVFKRVPIKITDEIATIFINGKMVDIGRKCTISGREVRVAFASDKQIKYFKDCQDNIFKHQEFFGRIKDDIFFVWGRHSHGGRRGGGALIIRKYRQRDARLAHEMTRDNCFTGHHRSGDTRRITAAIKLKPKFKIGKDDDA